MSAIADVPGNPEDMEADLGVMPEAVPAEAPPPPPEELAVAPEEPAAAPVVEDLMPEVAPVTMERLPPNFRKHVDPKSPVPLRGMAAKGLVPLGPVDMCTCLFMLASDADPGVVASAWKTASGLPDKILSVALRDDGASPRVLHFFAEALTGKDGPLEYIALNNITHDATLAKVASSTGSARILEIIANNQLRILRSEAVLRAVVTNPATSKALVDLTCDFTVRNGLCLVDLSPMVEAHIRVHGKPPVMPAGPEVAGPPPDSAEALLEEFGDQLLSPTAPPMEEGKRMNLTQQVAKMTISAKIKLATLGNKEARGILMRDPNKLVALAVINSPRITDGEVISLANSKTCQEDVLRVIYRSREWTRQHSVKIALVKNPKVPLAIAMRFMGTMREGELKDLANNKNVPGGIRMQAKKMTTKAPPKDDH